MRDSNPRYPFEVYLGKTSNNCLLVPHKNTINTPYFRIYTSCIKRTYNDADLRRIMVKKES